MKIEILIVIGAAIFGVYRIFLWVKNAKVAPDPWSREIEESLHQPDAIPVCHRCFSPQSDEKWFCPVCGTAVGSYNNYLPYIYIFSQGEVLRVGTGGRIRGDFLIVTGFFLASICSYFVFAPIYWYFLFKNLRRHSATELNETS